MAAEVERRRRSPGRRLARRLAGRPLVRPHGPGRAVVPGHAGDEVLQLVVARQLQPGRHRLQALALAGAE